MKTINIPTSLADLNLADNERLATTKGHVKDITKAGRKRIGKGLKNLGKLIAGSKK
jgi:hypothetical protein